MPSVQQITEYSDRDHGVKFSGTDLLQIIVPFEVSTDYSATSIIRLCRIPSNFVIVEGAITSKTDSSSLVANLGLYETPDNGGTLIEANTFLNGAALNSSADHAIDQIAIADQGKAVWELADGVTGFSYVASSRQNFDVVLTVTTAATSADEVCVLKMLLARKS
jgi:hypothetical protein